MAGMIVWHELFTTDVDAATRFYAELLDAEIETQTVGDLEYPMLKKGDGNHCGFVHNPSDGQIPSLWYPYLHADDVDASTTKAQGLGAQLIHGPQDVGDMLRFAVLGDPQHATFGLLTSEGEAPKGVFAWDELHATDVDAAASFYGDLAGWTTAEFMEGYRIFNAGETGVGGLMKERGGSPAAYWMTYLHVEDIDGIVERAMELGAGVILPTESMETIGRYAVLTDPTGAAFGLHQPPAETAG